MTKQTSWRTHRVLVFKGSRDTNKHDILERDYETRTLGEIFGMEPGSDVKNESLAMIPSAYARFDGRAHSVQREKGQFVALTADIDKGNHSYWDIEDAALSLFGRTIDCRIYSSSSATSEDKRWRIIAPLAEPMKFDDWNLWQRTLYAHLEERLGTPVDWSLARAAQPVYLPNVPHTRRHPNGKPIYYVTQVLLGEPITPDNAVALPAIERVRQADVADAQKAELARHEALERLKNRQSDPGYRGSPIEAYNAAHGIEDLLLANGYVEGKRNNWRSPYQTGKTFATRVFGDYWVSLSESDAGAGLGRACTSGRFGDAFDIYCHFEHGGDVSKAVRQAADDLGLTPSKNHSTHECDENALSADAAERHPFAEYVETEVERFVQEEFVLDGILVAGAVLLAGAWGTGKTTQLVPLMCRAAHLCQSDDPLRPLLRRRVVYVTEDVRQVQRILRSMRQSGEFEGISREEVSDWFKLVPALRMKPVDIIKVSKEYAKLAADNVNSVNGQSYVTQAVVVLDTRSAVIELDDENDNSEASAAIATFRQGMPDNPMVIVGHVPKTLSRADVKTITSRGAGAWEADVQQVLYLTVENEVRWLEVSTPKHRFVAQVDGVQFHAYRTTVPGVDPLGNPVDIALMHGVPTPVKLGERQKTQAEQASVAQKNRMGNLRVEVLDAVAAACALGNPLNRQALKRKIKAKHTDTLAMLDVLLHERWIAEIEIPKEHRTHPNSKSCLVSVSEAQRRIWLETGIHPNFKTHPTPQGSSVPMNVAQEPEARANDVCV